jgi:hypothetical protein
MSEDAKRSIAGGLTVKPPISDDRKPLSAAATTPPSGKRVIVKSADMLPEIQKEAVDTAIAVLISIFSIIGRSLYDFACCLVHKIFDYHLKCIVHPQGFYHIGRS